jgi:hypothetical protein
MSPNVTLEVGNRDSLLAYVIEESISSGRERYDSKRTVSLTWLDHPRASSDDFSDTLLDRAHLVQLRNSQTDLSSEFTARHLVIEPPDRKFQTLRDCDLP